MVIRQGSGWGITFRHREAKRKCSIKETSNPRMEIEYSCIDCWWFELMRFPEDENSFIETPSEHSSRVLHGMNEETFVDGEEYDFFGK